MTLESYSPSDQDATAESGSIFGPGNATDVKNTQMPHILDLGATDDDGEASENLTFAMTLFAQCKEDISLPNLENIIFLFRNIQESCESEPIELSQVHSAALRGLSSATGIRYVCTEDEASLVELLKIDEIMRREGISPAAVFSDDLGDDDTKEILELAQTGLEELCKSIPLSTLDTIIFLLQSSLTELPRGHPKRLLALKFLTYAVYMHFRHSRDISSVKDAMIKLKLEAQEPHEADEWLGNMANLTQFLASALPLAPAITRARGAAEQDAANDAKSATEDTSLLVYAQGLIQHFDASGDVHDLEYGIDLMQSGLTESSLSTATRVKCLNSLGLALAALFRQRGSPRDLDQAILFYRQALMLSVPPHPALLNNLAITLRTRFAQRGAPQDLDDAISFYKQALGILSPLDPHRAASLDNLGIALLARFEQYGDTRDLDQAVSFLRQALEHRPPPYFECYFTLLNLAHVLSARSRQRGQLEDLDETISSFRQALKYMPPHHSVRPSSLSGLAASLLVRFEQRHVVADLDEAISLNRQAVALLPSSHANYSASLNNLASTLSTRFRQKGDARDLDEAISFLRQALVLQGPTHPSRSAWFNNLAEALTVRFEEQRNAADFNEGISLFRQAVELLPSNHARRPPILANFAELYMSAYGQDGSAGDPSLLEEAMKLFDAAAQSISQSPSNRLLIARRWADLADLYKHPSAIQAFGIALRILPELAALGLDIQSRQDSLANGTDGIARKAAKCAIRMGDFGKAVEFLETGRSVFWSQFLHLRSPLDRLDDMAPQLAEDLRRISRDLEEGSYRDKSTAGLTNRQKLSLEQAARRFEELDKEWMETIERVRALRGFEDFLMPPKLSTLQKAAEGRPVIYLVANDDASDCLIITSELIHRIPLPRLGSPFLTALVELLRVATSELLVSRSLVDDIANSRANLPPSFMKALLLWSRKGDERGMREERKVPKNLTSDDIFRVALEVLWHEVVEPVVNYLGLKESKKRTIVTWCATGLFSFLPVHAASCYNDVEEVAVDGAWNYIFSSYTPTIGALLTPKPPPIEPFKMMAVIQSHTLPSTREELKKIEQHVSSQSLTKFGVPSAQASVEAVASCLSTASIVHFACHGKQDWLNPLKSGLEIEGERLTISRIMKESVPNGSLAVLNACETAMGDGKIPDEAMSIGTCLLLTGFRSVVATMWKMWDADGPVIADEFYRQLFGGPDGNSTPLPDTSKSIEALAIAANKLRMRGVPFKRWIPFVHIGM